MGWKKSLATVLLASTINCGNSVEGLLSYQKEKTNSSGKVTINDRLFFIKDKYGPLEDITIHYLESENKYLSLAIDQQGSHFPEIRNGTINNFQSKPLLGEILMIMTVAKLTYDFYKNDQARENILLEEHKNVNRYCMTLEQMQKDYLEVPAGMILLSLELAGYRMDEIKIAATTPLKSIVEKHIIGKYGEYESYEVWEPKIRVSLCGEEYDGLVCNIDSESLSKKLWNKAEVPLWRIVGSCQSPETELFKETRTDEEFNLIDNGDGTFSDTINNLMWKKNTHKFSWRDSVSFCSGLSQYSNWRLPTVNELEIYLLPETINNCYAPSIFNGCREAWFWSSETSYFFAQSVSYMFRETRGRDRENTSNGAKCVRNF